MFDLIEIAFGNTKTMARPFDFETDDEGSFIRPIKAITTCPECGHGKEVILDNEIIICDNCGFGKEEANDILCKDIKDEDIEDKKINNNKKELIKSKNLAEINSSDQIEILQSSSPFVDPIALGTFKIEDI